MVEDADIALATADAGHGRRGRAHERARNAAARERSARAAGATLAMLGKRDAHGTSVLHAASYSGAVQTIQAIFDVADEAAVAVEAVAAARRRREIRTLRAHGRKQRSTIALARINSAAGSVYGPTLTQLPSQPAIAWRVRRWLLLADSVGRSPLLRLVEGALAAADSAQKAWAEQQRAADGGRMGRLARLQHDVYGSGEFVEAAGALLRVAASFRKH